jgi:putative aminopeptidase FrvX
MHQEVEMCHQIDIQATLDLLKLAVENLDKGDWKNV